MEGFKYNATDPQKGIVPRANEQIFHHIESSRNANSRFMVRASYLQIYNEFISDLLKTDRGYLQIREDQRKGVFVEGLSEWAVRSPHEIYSLM
jgi:kinesin family protein 3/17